MAEVIRRSGGWRVRIDSWESLPPASRRKFLWIVGEHGGEWWGNGRAEFYAPGPARRCYEQISGLGLKAEIFYWIGA